MVSFNESHLSVIEAYCKVNKSFNKDKFKAFAADFKGTGIVATNPEEKCKAIVEKTQKQCQLKKLEGSSLCRAHSKPKKEPVVETRAKCYETCANGNPCPNYEAVDGRCSRHLSKKEPIIETRVKCIAECANGNPCKFYGVIDGLCARHQPKPDDEPKKVKVKVPKAKKTAEKPKCSEITGKGTPCSKSAIEGNTMCYAHIEKLARATLVI